MDDIDEDETRLPRTFSMKDVGFPTPRTTYLDEPPKESLPPPLSIPPYRNIISQYPGPSQASVHAFTTMKLSCDASSALCRSIDMIQK